MILGLSQDYNNQILITHELSTMNSGKILSSNLKWNFKNRITFTFWN